MRPLQLKTKGRHWIPDQVRDDRRRGKGEDDRRRGKGEDDRGEKARMTEGEKAGMTEGEKAGMTEGEKRHEMTRL